MVRALGALGQSQESVAALLHLNRRTFAKYYGYDHRLGRARASAIAHAALFLKAVSPNGDVRATIRFLKQHAGWREA